MANKYYYANSTDGAIRNLESNTRPTISTELDSVRAYSWELVFRRSGLDDKSGAKKPLTLAAKQVNGIGMSVEDIEVNRVNDKVYYPGRPSMEELVVTFDNLQKTKVDKILYELFSVTYDARTGVLGKGGGLGAAVAGGPTSVLKNEIDVLQLTGSGEIRNQIRLFGCYPKNITHGEYNYSTNEFHTLEMTFRYDYFATTSDADGAVNTTI